MIRIHAIDSPDTDIPTESPNVGKSGESEGVFEKDEEFSIPQLQAKVDMLAVKSILENFARVAVLECSLCVDGW